MRQNFAHFFTHFLLLLLLSGFSQKSLAKTFSEQKVVTGIVLLTGKTAPDYKALLSVLKTTWKLKADSVNTADKTLTFNTSGGATVMIAYLDYPAATDEIGAASRLSWLWKTANEETSKHQAQVVISVIGPDSRTLDLYKIFTQAVAGVLETTHSAGVYLGGQYLLLSKGYFTAAARNMVQNQTIPLYCWVYFGRPGGGNGFTFGLQEFGLQEMEVVQSSRSETEAHATLYDAAMTVLKSGTRLQDGQILTTDEGAKIKVSLAKGAFLEEQKVLKLAF